MRRAVGITVGSAALMTAMAGSRGASTAAAKQGAVIFLHGLGDSPAGWSSLERQLPQLRPRLKDVEWVFPAAPQTRITINGGAAMPGWFDLFDWPIGVGSKDDKPGKLAAVATIRSAIAALKAKGVPAEKIVVGGFSQGAAIAMLTAYHESPDQLAGCAALSGWLTLADELSVSDASKATPLFWAHGQYDDKVLFEQQAHGVKLLTEAGVSVDPSSYPMGHESHPKEVQALAAFIDRSIFPNECAADSA
eukprot:TRINITY_DN738_c0_g1_i1.p1 TRINITY_DN738_c0_g1~~TRINITY_DN738_c0_g1_i1.p1  ORF type:complete len:249 (+),score=81.50 TRINITY_DN738_c0_g1_i1:45-791(+)